MNVCEKETPDSDFVHTFSIFLWGVRIKRCTQKRTTVFEYPLPPFRHPVKLDTLLFGGILNSRDA